MRGAKVEIVLLDGGGAMATVGPVAGEFQRSRNASRQRIGESGIKEGHHVVDFRKGTPDILAEPEVQGQARTDFEIVLHIEGVCLVTSAGFGDRVLRDHAAIHRAQQITGIPQTR